MRFNRGTLILLAVLIVVIVAVLLINNQQATAPGEATATASTVSGPLLPGIATDEIVRYEVRNNTTGEYTALTEDTEGVWTIDSTNALAGREPEQALIESTAEQITDINYTNMFEDDELATFGLDQPSYTVFITTEAGQFYTIYIGAKAPTSSRYYAVVETANTEVETDAGEAGAVATADLSDVNDNDSAVLPLDDGDLVEITAEPLSDDASKPAARAQATEEVPDEGGAVATLELAGENENESGVMPEGDVTREVTSEATAVATADALPEITAEPREDPAVVLEGTQTIYLIPQTVIDTLTRWLVTPPYSPEPTQEPTQGLGGEAPPLLEEGASSELIPEGTPAATQDMEPDATIEPAAEATLEAS